MSTSRNADHWEYPSGAADHSGIYAALIGLALLIIAAFAVFLPPPTEDVDIWRAMNACPVGMIKQVDKDGEFKNCVLVEYVATPVVSGG